MNIISRWRLHEFLQRFPDARTWLDAWLEEAIRAEWKKPHDIKAQYGNASIIGGRRVVFNVCGNKYRMVVKFDYAGETGDIRFLGTHKEYDKINVKEV